MKFDKHLKEHNYPNFEFLCFVATLNDNVINEAVSQKTFDFLAKAADKLGMRLKRSDTLFDYLKGAGRGIQDLVRTASLYMLTDIGDKKSRQILVRDAKRIIARADKKEIAGFLLQIDRATLGITAHLRHLLMSAFGIEIATYNKWLPDSDYIKKELHHVREIMRKRGLSKEQIQVLKDLEKQLTRNIDNQNVIDAINNLDAFDVEGYG
jgi:hypothetical protein